MIFLQYYLKNMSFRLDLLQLICNRVIFILYLNSKNEQEIQYLLSILICNILKLI